MIVGLHGSGFANLVFSKPKTKVVELKDNNINEFTIDPKELGINSNNKDKDIEGW